MSSLKSEKQVTESVKRANRQLGMIKRTVSCRDSTVMLPLYKTLVRPHLEYCVQAWAPHYAKDINSIENVQKRFVRLISNLQPSSYEEKLKELNLFSMKKRRLRGDLIEVYKILNNIDNLSNNFFKKVVNNRTRGHSLKLKKDRCYSDIRKYFFSQRAINHWNNLPENVVTAPSLDSFKNSLDNYFIRRKIY